MQRHSESRSPAPPHRRAAAWPVVVLLAVAGCSPPRQAAPAAVARPLPTLRLEALSGEPASLSELARGRVTVIDLWASWCTACRPVSDRAARLAEAHGPAGLLVLGVDVGEERSEVEAFLDGAMPPYPIYLDPEFRLANALATNELPTVIVADRHGTVRALGHKLDAATVELVRALLAEP